MPLLSCPPCRACLCPEPQGYQLAHELEQLCGAGSSWGNACLHPHTTLPAKTSVCAAAARGRLRAPTTAHSGVRAQTHPPLCTEMHSRTPGCPCSQPKLALVCLVLTFSSNPKSLTVCVSSHVGANVPRTALSSQSSPINDISFLTLLCLPSELQTAIQPLSSWSTCAFSCWHHQKNERSVAWQRVRVLFSFKGMCMTGKLQDSHSNGQCC